MLLLVSYIILLYDGYPLAAHSSSVDVDTVLVSFFRASIPSILTEVAAPVSEKAFLTGWGEGNNLMLGHVDLPLDNDVGGVDDDVGGTFSLSFFFLLLLVLSCHPVTGKDSPWQVGYDLLIYSTFLSHPAGRSFVLVCRDRRG